MFLTTSAQKLWEVYIDQEKIEVLWTKKFQILRGRVESKLFLDGPRVSGAKEVLEDWRVARESGRVAPWYWSY